MRRSAVVWCNDGGGRVGLCLCVVRVIKATLFLEPGIYETAEGSKGAAAVVVALKANSLR